MNGTTLDRTGGTPAIWNISLHTCVIDPRLLIIWLLYDVTSVFSAMFSLKHLLTCPSAREHPGYVRSHQSSRGGVVDGVGRSSQADAMEHITRNRAVHYAAVCLMAVTPQGQVTRGCGKASRTLLIWYQPAVRESGLEADCRYMRSSYPTRKAKGVVARAQEVHLIAPSRPEVFLGHNGGELQRQGIHHRFFCVRRPARGDSIRIRHLHTPLDAKFLKKT